MHFPTALLFYSSTLLKKKKTYETTMVCVCARARAGTHGCTSISYFKHADTSVMFLGQNKMVACSATVKIWKKYKQSSTDFSVSVIILYENTGHKMDFH